MTKKPVKVRRLLTPELEDLIFRNCIEYVARRYQTDMRREDFFVRHGTRSKRAVGRQLAAYLTYVCFDYKTWEVGERYGYQTHRLMTGSIGSTIGLIEFNRKSDPRLDEFLTRVENEIMELRRAVNDKADNNGSNNRDAGLS